MLVVTIRVSRSAGSAVVVVVLQVLRHQPTRGAERGCYLRPSASGLALLHLLLGELGLLWVTQQFGYGDLDGLGGCVVGLPLVAQYSAGRLGTGLSLGVLDMMPLWSIRSWHSCSAAASRVRSGGCGERHSHRSAGWGASSRACGSVLPHIALLP